jgi:hypothetical protein
VKTEKMVLWVRQHLPLLLLTAFIILPTFSFVLGSALALTYIFWPIDISQIAMPSINYSAENIVVLAHGLNDDPSSWGISLKKSFEKQLSQEWEASQVIALNWNPYSANTLRCSVDGKRIGAALGKQMARSSQLHSVHLIGHSCGSFVVLGLCEALKAERSDIQIQSTYLAPVNIYGGIFWNYGINHFGGCADFSDAYIDRADTIGLSSKAPSNTYGFDITDILISTGIAVSPHTWPSVYYQKLVTSGAYPKLHNDTQLSKKLPSGGLEHVKRMPTPNKL